MFRIRHPRRATDGTKFDDPTKFDEYQKKLNAAMEINGRLIFESLMPLEQQRVQRIAVIDRLKYETTIDGETLSAAWLLCGNEGFNVPKRFYLADGDDLVKNNDRRNHLDSIEEMIAQAKEIVEGDPYSDIVDFEIELDYWRDLDSDDWKNPLKWETSISYNATLK